MLAYKILFVCFIITTTIGALTGVGIWFSVSLVNPYSIASLIRVFFWAWFVEWLVFITEVCLIVAYTLTWKTWSAGKAKERHIALGFALGFFSWVTMAIIVAILGFMMAPGNWLSDRTLLSGFTNPMYLPQLAFRTPLALAKAGIICMFLILLFTRRDDAFRDQALRAAALWTLFFTPLLMLGGWWYYSEVPAGMAENLGVSLLTLQFSEWQGQFLKIVGVTVAVMLVVVQAALYRPQRLPKVALLVPLFAIIWMTGHFERVREFIRKPYIIGQYMYANGLRVDDYPLLQRDGMLAHSTYSYPFSEAERQSLAEGANLKTLQDGKDVFVIACTRCHTTNGVNSIIGHFERMYGDQPWTPDLTVSYLENMHAAQPFMPPFPGNAQELQALAEYLQHLQTSRAALPGAQQAGIAVKSGATRDVARNPE